MKTSVRKTDVSKIINKWFNELYSYLGLDTLGLNTEQGYRVVSEILDKLYSESSTTPTLDAIIKKIKRHADQVNSMIALYLLTNKSILNDQQLEFVVINGGRVVVEYVSELYKLIKKKNRDDLVNQLMYLWEKYGYVSPVKCPKCGFRSIMPDYSCIICGYVVSEEYVREELDFDNKFKMYIEQASIAELRDVLNIGFVLLSDTGVYSPRYSHKLSYEKKIYFPIYLKSTDASLIYRALLSRETEV